MSTIAAAGGTKRYVHGLARPSAGGAVPTSCTVSAVAPEIAPGAAQAGMQAAVLSGSHVQVAWVTWSAGTGTAMLENENEQFNHVLEGALLADINGRIHHVPEGHAVHVPVGVRHAIIAAPGTDAHFIAVKDTRAGMFGSRDVQPRTWAVDAGGQPVAASPQVADPSTRYVYRWSELDRVPDGPCSAKVLCKGKVSGKSSSFGAALVGEKLQVGLIHKATGSGSKLHTHPNEQFNVVLQGALQADIDGQEQVAVPLHHAIHMPAGVVHSTMASAAGDVIFFVAKDTRHGLAGPPIDGIEDGPRYLPGFGPRK